VSYNCRKKASCWKHEMHIQAVIERIKRAFEKGETELMLTSFPATSAPTGAGRS
jgi:hypothetical protein